MKKYSGIKIKKILLLILGFIGVGFGAVGAVLPMLPAFPFLLIASVSFAKSSEKIHNWFINTNIYKKNLESYVKGHGMTWAAKIRVMITVTILMSFGFTIMMLKNLYIPCAVLAAVFVFHILYFIFGVKTYRPKVNL